MNKGVYAPSPLHHQNVCRLCPGSDLEPISSPSGPFPLDRLGNPGLVDGSRPGGWLRAALGSAADLQTLGLAAIVGLILVMSRLMERSGHMRRLVERFALLSRDARVVGAVMPALIGLLPMPGGALFSAPMVEASLHYVACCHNPPEKRFGFPFLPWDILIYQQKQLFIVHFNEPAFSTDNIKYYSFRTSP